MKTEILSPIGRLVMGSLYKPNTKNMQGAPLVDKSGNPRVEYWIHLAIQKSGEQHWNQTPWGASIYDVGVKSYPGGQYKNPNFAWKIVDGDSTVPNQNNTKPCDNEGYIGHWVLKFRSGFAPVLLNLDATPFLLPEGSINCGDYVQVFGSVVDNASTVQPGVYLNFTHVAFAAYGKRIQTFIDPKNIGFGGALPAGASATPVLDGFQASTPTAIQQPAAYVNILNPKKMTPAAKGSYEQYIAVGYTDERLVSEGLMIP